VAKLIKSYENNETFVQSGPAIPFAFNVNVLFTGYEHCDALHFAGPCYKQAYLLHIVLSGKGKLKINNTIYSLGKGDLFLIKPTDYVYYEADEHDPWEYRWIKFNGSSVALLLENAGLIDRHVFKTQDEAHLKSIERSMIDIYESMGDESAPYLKATGLFYVFFSEFLAQFNEQKAKSPDKMSFIKIVDYINQNFTKSMPMDEITRATNYNRSHIYKLFIKNFNCSPSEYIENLRMNLACEMLHETIYQIKEIGGLVGYNSYLSFVKIFKKHFALTPTEYRDKEWNEKKNQEIYVV
jgi:AraC-like DNA-binding protein